MFKSGIVDCVHKMPTAFKSGAELRKAIACRYYTFGSKKSIAESTSRPLDLSSFKFEQYDASKTMVPFSELHGSVIYAVRRTG